MRRLVRLAAFALPLVTLSSLPAIAQQAGSSGGQDKPVLPAADYSKIESLGAGSLSPDGKWVVYDVRRVSGGTELHYRLTGGGDDHVVPFGQGGEFTSNSRWLLYSIVRDTTRPPRFGRGRGRGRGGRGAAGGAGSAADSIHDAVGIVALQSGATTVLHDVQSFNLSADGEHAALRGYAPAGSRGRGADLVVRDLARGSNLTFGNVSEYAWSDDGALLALGIGVDGRTGNGVQLLNAGTGTVQALDAGDMRYTGLAWRVHSHDLALYRSQVDSSFVDTGYVVMAWRDLGSPRATAYTYDFADDTSSAVSGLRVAAYRAPEWSADGRVLFIGFQAREPRRHESRQAHPAGQHEPARVEVWHWKDLREYHQQDREASRDRQRTLLAAWRVGAHQAVPLTNDYFADVQLADSGQAAVVVDETPYFDEIISGRSYRDVYTVDLATGRGTKVLTKVPFAPDVSPTGRYLLYVQGGEWWSYDRTTGARANLTGKLGRSFVNMEDDHPVADRRPYGVAGWTSGEQSVLLQDRYDLWQVHPDGSGAVRLTRGAEDSTVYRVEQLDDDGFTIDTRRPIWLSVTGAYSKRSGYAQLEIGHPAQPRLWLDKGVARLTKADAADVYAYEVQAYEQSPNLYVGSAALTDARQVSHNNEFLGQFAWGRQDLLDYVNARGDTLQMMLTYPVNYHPGTKYPMVVYYYESLSQGFHQFVVPTDRSVYNTTVFSQNGYFVLRPDIRFEARNPGFSGLDCVTAAVKTVLAMGMVDPKRVGNMGHSWGGYQSAFYAVHGHGLFAATIAGAPLTDLISMYGYTSFNSGRAETGHFETGQERMDVPLWEDERAYIANSTVFAVDSLQTPLLLEEGDADGNVNYWQSMELYNFGRRLGKHIILLIYNGENHNPARPESQRDYHTRQLEWFGHYLKGEPAAGWMTNGETYLGRQEILNDAASRKGSGGRPNRRRPQPPN